MGFLYFPEDKSEYFPAAIILFITIVVAAITVYFLYKSSQKQAEKIDQEYKLNQEIITNKVDENKHKE